MPALMSLLWARPSAHARRRPGLDPAVAINRMNSDCVLSHGWASPTALEPSRVGHSSESCRTTSRNGASHRSTDHQGCPKMESLSFANGVEICIQGPWASSISTGNADLGHAAATSREQRTMPGMEPLHRQGLCTILSGVDRHLDNPFDVAIYGSQGTDVHA